MENGWKFRVSAYRNFMTTIILRKKVQVIILLKNNLKIYINTSR